MGHVIMMETSKRVSPKVEHGMYMGHRYVLRFDPNGPPDERWVWLVKYTCVYEYYGEAATIQAASRAAKRQIRELVSHE